MKKLTFSKKIISLSLCLVLTLGLIISPINLYEVRAEAISVGGGGTVNVGSPVTVSISVPSNIWATLSVSYDAGVLQYTNYSGAEVSGGGGGLFVQFMGESSCYITFNAISPGSVTVSATAIDAFYYDTEGAASLSGGSVAVTVNNVASSSSSSSSSSTGSSSSSSSSSNSSSSSGSTETTTNKDTKKSDSSLSNLKISPGTLSPTFSSGTKNYTAYVDENVSSISVSATAKASSSGAKVKSVSGNDALSLGANTVKIVVSAADGTTSTYTITVYRGENKEEEDEIAPVNIGGEELSINRSLKNIEAPSEDYSVESIDYKGSEIEAYVNDKMGLKLVSLKAEEEDRFFMLDEESGELYSYMEIGGNDGNYIVPLPMPSDIEVPDGYKAAIISTDEFGTLMGYNKITASGDAVQNQLNNISDSLKDASGNAMGDLYIDDTELEIYTIEDIEKEEDILAKVKGFFSWLFGSNEVKAAEVEGDFDSESVYTIYAVNSEGERGWYDYDVTLDSYIKSPGLVNTIITKIVTESVPALDDSEEITTLQKKNELYLMIMAIGGGILILIIVFLLLFWRKKYKLSYEKLSTVMRKKKVPESSGLGNIMTK